MTTKSFLLPAGCDPETDTVHVYLLPRTLEGPDKLLAGGALLEEGVDYVIEDGHVTVFRAQRIGPYGITFGWGPAPVTSYPPVADFTADVTTGDEPLEVTFSDTSTNTPTSWAWDFGDGGTSASQNPAHTYTDAGTYTVELVATNASGSDGETKVDYIEVTEPALPQPDGWDPDAMLGPDDLHPNDTGMTYLADAYEWALADAGVTPSAGSTIYAYGDSWTANDEENTPGMRAIVQLADRLDVTLVNRAHGGYRSADVAAMAIGTSGTWTPGTSGVVVVAAGLNDLIETDDARRRAATLTSLRALFASLSAAERIEEDAFTFSGSWLWTGGGTPATTLPGSNYSDGDNAGTGTESASATCTITTPGTYYLLTQAVDGSSLVGGKLTITQGATTLAELDLNSKAVNTGERWSIGAGPAAVRLDGVTAGSLTVTYSKNGRTGTVYGFLDSLVRISSTPPTILAVKPVRVLISTHDKPSALDYVRDTIDTLAAEFGSHVIVCDPDPSWVP